MRGRCFGKEAKSEEYLLKQKKNENIMNKQLKNEIITLEQEVRSLIESDSDISKMALFKSLVRLRVRYGFNVFGGMAFADAYGMINEEDHHLIAFAKKGIHILYTKDVFVKDKATGTPPFKYLCYIRRNKYGQIMGTYEIETFTRISFDFLSHYSINHALGQFESFDENEFETILTRKEKLQKISKHSEL